MKKLTCVLLALVLIPLATACGRANRPADAPTPLSSPTATAVEPTTAPSPTDTASPEPTVTLIPPSSPTPTEEPEQATIEGTVLRSALSARLITLTEAVQGFDVVALTNGSEITFADGQAAALGDVLPGMTLRATGTPGQSGALLADQVRLLTLVERIAFEPGATSAFVNDRPEPNRSQLYRVRAAEGETMRVSVMPPADELLLGIRGADGTVLKSKVVGESFWTGRLPATQDYVIEIAATGEPVDYQLGVVIPVRIAFEPGETSGIQTGHLAQHDVHHYVLWAAAGQRMDVAVTAPEQPVGLTIVGADGIPLKRYVDEETTWSGELPVTQDYFLETVSIDETDYELSVTIHPQSAEPSIEVVSPGPGETWYEGEIYEVRWRSTGVEHVDIALAVGGKDRGFIAQGIDAAAGSTTWSVPHGIVTGFGVAESSGRVMVSDTGDPTINDENDGPFTLSAPRIQFEPGATSAVVEAQAGAWYALRAAAGQSIYLSLAAPYPVNLSVVGGDLWLQSGGLTFAAFPSLPSTRDYLVGAAKNASGAAGWPLRIAVEPLGTVPRSIHFDPGATSASVDGSLAGGGDHAGYTLRASAGQTLAVEVEPPSWGGGIWVSRGGDALGAAPYGEDRVSVTLPTSGDYFIALLTPPGADTLDYVMTVTVTP